MSQHTNIEELQEDQARLHEVNQALNDRIEALCAEQAEHTGLLTACRAVLSRNDFQATARAVFDACSELVGATSGYVALLSDDGSENEVLFLESGGLPCSVDPDLPMPIRGLRAVSYRENRVVYENDFGGSEHMAFMPDGHVHLKNVMFSPLILDGRTVGLMGLANKASDFTENDARLARTFGELAAIALENSRIIQALEEGEQRYRALFEGAPDAILLADAVTGAMCDVNEAACRLLQSDRKDLIGRHQSEIHPPEIRGEMATLFQEAVHTLAEDPMGIHTQESLVVRADGTRVPVDIAAQRVLLLGRPVIQGTFRDITDRKRAEGERRKALLELSRSNEELEQFAYAASHDLQEPLRMVSSYLELLKSEYKGRLGADADEYIGFAMDGANRMRALIQDLLEYSRVGRTIDLEVGVDLGEVVRQTLSTLSLAVEDARATVRVHDLPTVTGDPAQLGILFQNLVANAIKFRTQRPVVIEISAKKAPGQWVIMIEDNGVGIEPRLQERIFDVFARLHPRSQYPGTGMGLAICRKIVERHGGRIWLESESGQGTVFFVSLPRSDQVAVP